MSNGIQIVDEECTFNDDLQGYLQTIDFTGLDYHVISVFGSQSTGKSTLLNGLFGTQFEIMNEHVRKQTTKGIWLDRARVDGEHTIVMDVEGTDGRERGDDQDFERRSALFSLATSEIIIINLWEHQVGLYQGANMGLLKTVFEVDLQMFLASGQQTRSLLFFVIRDHIGAASLEGLAESLRADLGRIWASITKPSGYEQSKIEDFFDLEFTSLPHKVLVADGFKEKMDELKESFKGQEHFKKEYKKNIPFDGFYRYGRSCWDQILANKDLDLPTQQVLLAQFRCDEIMQVCEEQVFSAPISQIERQSRSGTLIPDLGMSFKQLEADTLKAFDVDASRYHKETYLKKRADFIVRLHRRMQIIFLEQIRLLHKNVIDEFLKEVRPKLKAEGHDFKAITAEGKQKAISNFTSAADKLLIEGDWTYQDEMDRLGNDLDEVTTSLRITELGLLMQTTHGKLKADLFDILDLIFKTAQSDMWTKIFESFGKFTVKFTALLQQGAERIGALDGEVAKISSSFQEGAWKILEDRIQDETADTSMMLRLRERFEDSFRYDASGLPRLWKPTDDIDGIYGKAKEETLQLISRFSNETGQLDVPTEVERPEDPARFTHLISRSRQLALEAKFRKAADAIYLEAKRSVSASITQIPIFIYILLVILGWNEFMAIVRNPVLFALILLFGTIAFFAHALGLSGPLLQILNAAAQKGVDIAREGFNNFLQPPQHIRPIVEQAQNAQ